MMKLKLIFGLVALFLLIGSTAFSQNITIDDLNSRGNGWYGGQEDDEVEPGMAKGQVWDLEGMFLEGTTLSVVGGYDFINGEDGFTSGDLFLDIDGDAVYGDIHGSSNGNHIVTHNSGYDYVLDLDFVNLTYDIYAIDTETYVQTSYYKQNQGSNPWLYESGGELIAEDLAIEYTTESEYGIFFNGGWHNQFSVDISFLLNDTAFIAHYTMGCGNDNLMGQGVVVHHQPEPGTMLMLGFGLIGIAGLSRRKMQ